MRNIFRLTAIMLVLTALISGGCSEPVLTPYTPPVSSVMTDELPTDFPENLRWLTDEEKQKIIDIALNTPAAQEWLQKESQYKTNIDWIALNPDHEGEGYSGYQHFEYEIVGKGIPRGTLDITPADSHTTYRFTGVPEDAEIYPNVTIWFGEPARWVVSVAVDLEAERAVYVEDYPFRTGPTPPETNG